MEAQPYRSGDEQAWFERSCEGKEAHPSEAAADAALRMYRRMRAVRGANGLESYQCTFCRQWHLGHPLPQRARRR